MKMNTLDRPGCGPGFFTLSLSREEAFLVIAELAAQLAGRADGGINDLGPNARLDIVNAWAPTTNHLKVIMAVQD